MVDNCSVMVVCIIVLILMVATYVYIGLALERKFTGDLEEVEFEDEDLESKVS